ncbi:hypothetical protein AB9E26_36955, partial [Rhizobium leguminosarum]
LVAIGDNDPHWEEEYQKLGTTAGAYYDWHEGKDPAGITTQDPELMKRLDPIAAGERDGLGFQRHKLQIVRETAAGGDW